jgi:ribosomal protein S18 acetylase RimI-like enzyme
VLPRDLLIRGFEPGDLDPVLALATAVIGPERSGAFVRSYRDRHHLLVAGIGEEVAGCLAYRTDWFGCTFVTLVSVREDFRRQGIARALYRAVEEMSPSPRVFSSTEETNTSSIRMHTAIGFTPSGYIDNLPQGYRELLFYRRRRPGGASDVPGRSP